MTSMDSTQKSASRMSKLYSRIFSNNDVIHISRKVLLKHRIWPTRYGVDGAIARSITMFVLITQFKLETFSNTNWVIIAGLSFCEETNEKLQTEIVV